MQQYLPFAAVMSALGNTLDQCKSGTFFIATDTNASARFGISEGKINQCTFKRFHGEDALKTLSDVKSARYSFAENACFPFRSRDNVDHVTALELLGIALPGFSENYPVNGSEPIRLKTPPSLPAIPKYSFEEIHRHAKVKKQVYDGQIIELDD
ncbi:MAG: hypothetical protein ACPGSM_07995 [Thiolinea sp.]